MGAAPLGVRRSAGRRACWAWAAVLVSACTSLPPAPPAAADAASRYTGRFSLAVTRAEPQRADRRDAWSGRFTLVLGAQTVALDLVSPLGATLARIESGPAEARLLVPADGGVRVERGPDAEALAERVLGWSLPIAGLPDWIAGHPAAGRPFRVLSADLADGAAPAGPQDPPGPPERFEQDGWTVVVERPAGLRAALRLQMSRPAQEHSPAVALRVVVDVPAEARPATAPEAP